MLGTLFHRHQRLASQEEEAAAARDDRSHADDDQDVEEGRRELHSSPSTSSATAAAATAQPEAPVASQDANDDEDVVDVDLDDLASTSSMPPLVPRLQFSEDEEDPEVDDEEDEEGVRVRTTAATLTQHLTLAELEEERELARRRSSACVMFSVFVLFRLWIEAIQQGDFGLLMLSLVGTSWTFRWIRHNREREEELDRRIAQYLEQQQQQQQNGGTAAAGGVVDRGDLRMLSFQAQLALAIMESQRQMMQGGFGNPDGNASVGVSESAKSTWEQFPFKKAPAAAATSKKAGYGSVSQKDDDNNNNLKAQYHHDDDDEEPHCSICLCEYENGETLTKLPCSHIYHDECISSWTSSHTKCPLCNFDLESAPPSSQTRDDSIV